MIARLRKGLRGLRWRPWGDGCPGGTPVPEAHRCAAVDCDSVCLTTLGVGDHATVTCLEEPASAPSRKLAAMGVLPGMPLELVQRYPGFVFRIGHAEIAVDDVLARRVRVRRD
jgi:DtxR family transcriptional regulator, Mn-dependent transcriptional regulator